MSWIRCDSGGTKPVEYLGTSRTYDLRALGISDYASLTVDNFICLCRSGSVNGGGTQDGSYGANFVEATKTYDPSTGALTLSGGYVRAYITTGRSASANLTIDTYIVRKIKEIT